MWLAVLKNKKVKIMKKISQEGFSLPETLLIAVIVGVLGFVGWYVWNAKTKTNNSFNNATKALGEPGFGPGGRCEKCRWHFARPQLQRGRVGEIFHQKNICDSNLRIRTSIINKLSMYACVAQWIRALRFGRRSRRFESVRGHQ